MNTKAPLSSTALITLLAKPNDHMCRMNGIQKIEVTEEQINNALKLMDTDKDGKISKEEFRKTSRTKLLAIVNDNSS